LAAVCKEQVGSKLAIIQIPIEDYLSNYKFASLPSSFIPMMYVCVFYV